jgi:hypothetical protein
MTAAEESEIVGMRSFDFGSSSNRNRGLFDFSHALSIFEPGANE